VSSRCAECTALQRDLGEGKGTHARAIEETLQRSRRQNASRMHFIMGERRITFSPSIPITPSLFLMSFVL
jgi:hypothetical protein